MKQLFFSPDGSCGLKKNSDISFEFPIINPAYSGKNAKFVYGASIITDWFQVLVKVSLESFETLCTWKEPNCYVSEPCFVPRENSVAEDDGYLVANVLNVEKRVSFLLCLDANSFQEVFRANFDWVVPFGLHGNFSTSE